MNIAWYTPFSQRSAIGAFSAQVVSALQARDVAVTVVRSEMEDESLASEAQIATDCPVFWAHHWHRDLEQRARDFDLVIYNIGDHFPFHAYCMAHLPRVPGVVILHDYHVHNLLAGCATWDEITLPPYAQMLERDHGQEVADSLAEAIADGRHGEWIRTEQPRYPVISDPFGPALGVVAHAEYYRRPCAGRLGVPTAMIPLAYRGVFDGRTHPVPRARQRRRLITFGNVNPNKCYPAIIRALGHDARLAAGWEYRIVGDYAAGYRSALEQLVRQQPHAVELTFTGRVTNDHLAEELRNADAIACLRHPVLEGASASVIEALQAARPVLVNDAGCYAEIPRECAYHVIPGDHETATIQRHLRDIHDDPEQAAHKARRASEWAIARHDTSRYAERLLAFLDEVLRERPVLELVDRVMQYAARWSEDSSRPLARALETHVHALFPRSVTKPATDPETDPIPVDIPARMRLLRDRYRPEDASASAGVRIPAWLCRGFRSVGRKAVLVVYSRPRPALVWTDDSTSGSGAEARYRLDCDLFLLHGIRFIGLDLEIPGRQGAMIQVWLEDVLICTRRVRGRREIVVPLRDLSLPSLRHIRIVATPVAGTQSLPDDPNRSVRLSIHRVRFTRHRIYLMIDTFRGTLRRLHAAGLRRRSV